MQSKAKQQWEQCRGFIRDNVTPEQYSALFSYTEFQSFENKRLVLSVPSQFIFDQLERDDYARLIASAIRKFFGLGIELAFKIPVVQKAQGDIIVGSAGKPNVQNGTPTTPANQVPDPFQVPTPAELDSQLHEGYYFDNFYEGENNRLARSVGEAIAKCPAKTFNPFFLYGPSGCGKTHLVNAIGWRIKELHPNLRVLYLSAHLFVVQYQDAVRQNKTPDLIAFYQTIDVLIIDDIQEFSGKLKSQNTFFHIFNHLHLNNKQLILTADRPPVLIDGLEDRLLTRFKWGLQAEIEKPTKALCYRILQGKVKHDGLQIADDVLAYIAENVETSIRDLEGIITSLMAHSVVYDCDIDIRLVNQFLPRFTKQQTVEEKVTLDEIRTTVCNHFNLNEDVIDSPSRKREVVYARQIIIYLANTHTEQSTVQIGRQIGGRSHATVIHSINQVKNLMEVDEKARQEIQEIEALL